MATSAVGARRPGEPLGAAAATASPRPAAGAIAFRDVRLTLGGAVIYESVSFDVHGGEFVCLLGPSGCGKSTALRLAGDLMPLQGGTIAVDGHPPHETWERLAYVFQTPRLLPWRDALDNAAFGLEMRRPEMSRADRRRRALLELERVGLAADVHKSPAMLSGGERQRVAIARALALDPEIIFMDEPFSALDPNTRLRLRDQIVALWRSTGKTILFVTHDMDEALYLAQRIVVLSPKPTRVAEEITVVADRPRDVLGDPVLLAYRKRLLDLFRDMGEVPV
jgi:NitT/TauT family transport system ATP-binding protein